MFNLGFNTTTTTMNANVETPQVINPATAQTAPAPSAPTASPAPAPKAKGEYKAPADAHEAKARIVESGENGKLDVTLNGKNFVFTNKTKVPVLLYLRREFRMLGGEFNGDKTNPAWTIPFEYWTNPDAAVPSKRGETPVPTASAQNAQGKSQKAAPTADKVSMSYARRIAMEAARILCPNVGDEALRAIVEKAILNVNDKKARKTA